MARCGWRKEEGKTVAAIDSLIAAIVPIEHEQLTLFESGPEYDVD